MAELGSTIPDKILSQGRRIKTAWLLYGQTTCPRQWRWHVLWLVRSLGRTKLADWSLLHALCWFFQRWASLCSSQPSYHPIKWSITWLYQVQIMLFTLVSVRNSASLLCSAQSKAHVSFLNQRNYLLICIWIYRNIMSSETPLGISRGYNPGCGKQPGYSSSWRAGTEFGSQGKRLTSIHHPRKITGHHHWYT